MGGAAERATWTVGNREQGTSSGERAQARRTGTSHPAQLSPGDWAWSVAIAVALVTAYAGIRLRANLRGIGDRLPSPGGRFAFVFSRLTIGPAALLASIAFVGVGAALAVDNLLRPDLPDIPPYTETSMILDASGEVVATLHGEENRIVVPMEEISPYLRHAVIAAEDREFYEHNGISWRGIVRAARVNLDQGETVQGGSTITQQYVRNAFPEVGLEKTFDRKAKEALWAMEVERKYGKDEILQAYLNTVYFGKGAYGAEAAAQTYFDVSAAQLTPGQAAYLAAALRSPSRYQIDERPEAAIQARNDVLRAMEELGTLSADQSRLARNEDLVAQFRPALAGHQEGSARAGYFVEYVRRTMKSKFQFTDAEILGGGLRIHTTMDLRMQRAAEEAVATTLDRPDDPEAALIAMDAQGRVRAMVGGRNVTDPRRARGFNFAADVQNRGGGRPAGSAFKPIALASFLEDGNSVYSTFVGHSTLEITSERCQNEDGSPWEVSNYGNAGFGALNLISATTNSVNTVYAQLMEAAVSPESFMETAADLGIRIPEYDRGCALTLGTTDVTPMEMAGAYTTFAQRGMRPDPLIITKVTGPDGAVIKELNPSGRRVLDPNTADTLNYVLQRNVQAGTGTSAQIGRPAAGKTGTTQDWQNAWFAGYTPQLTAVVWMGFAPEEDGTIPVMRNVRGRSVTGGSFPAQIWARFMRVALEGTEESSFERPALSGQTVRYRVPEDDLHLAEAGDEDEESDDQEDEDQPEPDVIGEPVEMEEQDSSGGEESERRSMFDDCFPFCNVNR